VGSIVNYLSTLFSNQICPAVRMGSDNNIIPLSESQRWRGWVTFAWCCGFALFAVPLVLQSLAMQLAPQSADLTGAAYAEQLRRSTLLLLASLAVASITTVALTLSWNRIVRRIGNGGLATIAMIAGMQFTVAFAARVIGSLAGVLLGPYYLFIDGIGSKGLSCLLLGVLVALMPLPGVLALSLATLYVLNAIASGQMGLVSLLFIAVTIALHELFAAALGVTVGRHRPVSQNGSTELSAVTWNFALRLGLAIGMAQGLSLFAQYEMYKVLARLDFSITYKIAVSAITGLLYGGVGATCGAFLGGRLRRVAP